jgi:hypothetical protein
MSPVLKNIVALLAGLVAGGLVNMALVTVGPVLIPPPAGVDMTDMDSLAQSMHLMGPQHFVFPLLAHALGTVVGATLTFALAARNSRFLAFGIGVFFLLGGISAARMIPAPTWFVVVDLAMAYLPMAWLGTLLGKRLKKAIKTNW